MCADNNSPVKSVVFHALAWIWNAFITSVISGAGLFFIAVVVEYVKQYSRERRELQRERDELERAYLLSQSPILPRSITSKGAAIFSSYRNSPAFLSGTAFPRRRRSRYMYQPNSLNYHNFHPPGASNCTDYEWLDSQNYVYPEHSIENFLAYPLNVPEREFMQPGTSFRDEIPAYQEEEKGNEHVSPLNQPEQKSTQSATSVLAENIKLKHGIKTWSGVSTTTPTKETKEYNRTESQVLRNPHSDFDHSVANGGERSSPSTSNFQDQMDQPGLAFTISFQKQFITDMVTNYPFIVPFLRDMFLQSQNDESVQPLTNGQDVEPVQPVTNRQDVEVNQALPVLVAGPNEKKESTADPDICEQKDESKTRLLNNYMKFMNNKKTSSQPTMETNKKTPGPSDGDKHTHFNSQPLNSSKPAEKKLISIRPGSPASTSTQRPQSPRLNTHKLNLHKTNSQKSNSPSIHKQSKNVLRRSKEQKAKQISDLSSSKKKTDHPGALTEHDTPVATSRPQSVETSRQQRKPEAKSSFISETSKKKPVILTTRRDISLENSESVNDFEDEPQPLNRIIYNFSTPFEHQKVANNPPTSLNSLQARGYEAYSLTIKDGHKIHDIEGISPPIAHSHCTLDPIHSEISENTIYSEFNKARQNCPKIDEQAYLCEPKTYPSPKLEFENFQTRRFRESEVLPVDLSKPRKIIKQPSPVIYETEFDEHKVAAVASLFVEELNDGTEDNIDIVLDDVIKKQEELMSMIMKKKRTPTHRSNYKPKFITTVNREASWNKTVTRLRNAALSKMSKLPKENGSNMAVNSMTTQVSSSDKTKHQQITPALNNKTLNQPIVSQQSDNGGKKQDKKSPLPTNENGKSVDANTLDAGPIRLNAKKPNSYHRQLTKAILGKTVNINQKTKNLSPSVQKSIRKLSRPGKIKKAKVNKMPTVIYDSKEGSVGNDSESNSLTDLSGDSTVESCLDTVIENDDLLTKAVKPVQQTPSVRKSVTEYASGCAEVLKARSQPNVKKTTSNRLTKWPSLDSKTVSLRKNMTPRRSYDPSQGLCKSTGFKTKHSRIKTTKQKDGKVSTTISEEKTKSSHKKTRPNASNTSSRARHITRKRSSESLYTSYSESCNGDDLGVNAFRAGDGIKEEAFVESRFILKKSVLDEVVQQLKLGSFTD